MVQGNIMIWGFFIFQGKYVGILMFFFNIYSNYEKNMKCEYVLKIFDWDNVYKNVRKRYGILFVFI